MAFLTHPDVVGALASAFALGLTALVHFVVKRWSLNQDKADAIRSISLGVAAIGQSIADDLKKANGVLSDDQKAMLRRKAIEAGIAVASDGAKKVIAAWSAAEGDVIVEAAVRAQKIP